MLVSNDVSSLFSGDDAFNAIKKPPEAQGGKVGLNFIHYKSEISL